MYLQWSGSNQVLLFPVPTFSAGWGSTTTYAAPDNGATAATCTFFLQVELRGSPDAETITWSSGGTLPNGANTFRMYVSQIA